MFCWTEAGAEAVGILQSLVLTCRLHGVDPYTWLVDVLQRISVHPARDVAQLTPRLWKGPLRREPDDIRRQQGRAHEGAAGSLNHKLIKGAGHPASRTSQSDRLWTPPMMQAFCWLGLVHVIRCCRPSGLMMRLDSTPRATYGESRTGSTSLTRARSLCVTGGSLPDPVSLTFCPYPFLRSCPHPRQIPSTRRPIRRRQEPGNSASSSSQPRRCAPSCWPVLPRSASAACAPAAWRARGPASNPGGPHGARPPWRR